MATSYIPKVEIHGLILRPPLRADTEVWAAQLTGDPQAMRQSPTSGMTPHARAARSIASFGRIWEQDGTGAWVITRNDDSQMIGYCYVGYQEGIGAFELGYSVPSSEWAQGAVTEAARAAVRFAFEHGSMDHIVAVVVPGSAASVRVLEHLGFVYEKDTTLSNQSLAQYRLSRDRFTPGDHTYRLTFHDPVEG
jgi:[ribosomal protein S5]-alanine N-acetyltransferase